MDNLLLPNPKQKIMQWTTCLSASSPKGQFKTPTHQSPRPHTETLNRKPQTRHGTPTTWALEEAFAAVEGGVKSVCVASGVAAINTAMLAFVQAGDHILVIPKTQTLNPEP